MSILLVGMNHRSAPIEVREQLAFSREGVATALMLFHNRFPQSEAAILSTCNRVEMIVAAETGSPTADDIVSFLAQARDIPVNNFRHYLYQFTDEQAVRHLFRVASGLDSMVVGEYQIIHQLKTAYAQAGEQGSTGRLLNRLFHHAFSVAKRIHSETDIATRKVSIPSVAVDVAQSIFTDLADKRVLVVGAGDMAQLLCQHLRSADVRQFTITSRTLANARALADACDGACVPYERMDEELARADLVITAVSCPKALITADRVRLAQKLRHNQPLFMIDLAVPRNIDAAVEKLNGVYVYDVDALGRIVADNQQYRINQMPLCEKILDHEIDAFEQWLGESRVRPLIEQIYSDAHRLRDAEVARTLAACPDLTDAQRQAVEQLADRLIGKFMHPCATTLRQCQLSRPTAMLVEALHEITEKSTATSK
ncbi:MAG: glutamyl-tRNA reductase [Phycisphaerales bacterium]